MIKPGSSAMCPHCGVGVRFEVAKLHLRGTPTGDYDSVYFLAPSKEFMWLSPLACPVCGRIVLSVTHIGSDSIRQHDGPGVVYPHIANRQLPAEVTATAPELAEDFKEAAAIVGISPKASAALSRRCLQFLLVENGKTKKRNLADQIDDVIGVLPSQLAHDVDAVRHIGNFAAHPMKSTHTKEVAAVEPGEAEWLLDIIEQLADYYYVAPARSAARRAALNVKLEAHGKPPLKQPKSEGAA